MRLRGRVARLPAEMRSKVALDLGGGPEDTVLLAAVGRSGTTWLSDLIRDGTSCRVIFEPFVPSRVPLARPLGYLTYIPRGSAATVAQREAARRILSGHLGRNPWTDKENHLWIARRRLVKAIRANLMLGWLVREFPGLKVILLMRHPVAVAHSWRRLGWGRELDGERTDLEILTAQSALVRRHLAHLVESVERATEPFERHLYEWCILNIVPLRECRPAELHLMFYETLYARPEQELERLGAFLGRRLHPRIYSRLDRPSSQSTSTSAIATGADPIAHWKSVVTPGEVERAMTILAQFDLDQVYGEAEMPDPVAASQLLAAPWSAST